ncbi:hypothetical protein RND71_014413 [Anisodus tanguticus]|uniref:RNase H type-1 domain-containing protein n=1 Tax=Anisodus tanguticus TaxID=243964 RepID=A0AAE1VE45_9SOLA|nr:hypothetical protein RND71_014413 [Anisodus tanguticus]
MAENRDDISLFPRIWTSQSELAKHSIHHLFWLNYSSYNGQIQLLALKKGLQLAHDLNFYPLEIETDSTDVITALHKGNDSYDFLVSSCIWLIHQVRKVQVYHNFREANQVSHLLAKAASNSNSEQIQR